MKKLLLCSITFSILFFQCQGSEQTPEEFFKTEITQEYVDAHYPGFIEDTRGKYKLMHGGGVKAIGKVGRFFSRLLGGTMSEDDVIQRLAGALGYNEGSRRLLGIGKEVLDDQWEQRLVDVQVNYSYEHTKYLNEAKRYIENNLTAPYNTNDSLNQTMHHLHHFHVDILQKEQNFDDDYATYLKQNYEKNNAGMYPMHAYVNQYKNENNGQVHPRTILNIFLMHLFALNKVTSKGS